MQYNPYLANPYLPLYSQGQPVMPQAMQYQQPVNGITQVNGRDSAMQYQLPPNSTSPALFDKSGTCFYVVSTDGTGTKSIECFDFTPHKDEVVLPQQRDYVSRQEFDNLVNRVNMLIGGSNGTDGPVQAAATEVGSI